MQPREDVCCNLFFIHALKKNRRRIKNPCKKCGRIANPPERIGGGLKILVASADGLQIRPNEARAEPERRIGGGLKILVTSADGLQIHPNESNENESNGTSRTNKKITTMAKKEIKKIQKELIEYNYRVRLFEDDKYHWKYDLHLLKNPAVLIDVLKVLGIALAIVGCFMFLVQACDNGVNIESLSFVLKLTGIMAAIMVVVGLLGYLLYAAMSGWKYTALFTMDENGVVHEQSVKAQKIGEGIGLLTILAGLLSKRPGVTGAGMMAAGRSTMSSDFSKVKKVKAIRWMNLIKVNEPFSKNRIYVNDADFDFVYDYISSHCKKEGVRNL